MKATARPFLSALKCRCYASQAAAQQASQHPAREGAKLTRAHDGSVVVAAENNSPVARVAFIFNAGSRYESSSQAGITHYIRNATNLSTKERTAFGIQKRIQQMGSDLTVTTTREHMILSGSCLRDNLYQAVELVRLVALEPAYKSWEVRDMTPPLELDVAKYHSEPATMMMESLHEVAYRRTLGNSLYIPEHKIGAYNFEDLHDFKNTHLTPANMAVVAIGTDAEEFAFQVQHRWGSKESQPSKTPQKVKATYHGGEKRIDTPSSFVHACVVTEGASLGSKDLIPLALLQRIMGTGPTIKYSDNLTSQINKAVSEAAKGPFAASSVNINYSDSGLFGFSAIGQAEEMDTILKTCAATFGNATKDAISEKDLARAKGSLKAAIYMSLEDGDNLVTELGTQALLTGELIDPSQISAEIDKATVADVQNVAKRVINGKPSMAAVGNLAHTPYLDQLV